MSNVSSSDNEAQSSNLDSENQETCSPKELLEDIIKSLEEYTTENANELLRHKTKLLTTLKSHRPLKIGEYHNGLSVRLKKDRRLIVFEWKDKTMVREYTQNNQRIGLWECRECDLRYRKKLESERSFVYMINGIVFVPNVHYCKPRDYNLVMQYQKYLEEGNVPLARRMSKTVNFDYGQDSFGNTVNVVQFPTSSLKKDSNLPASANLKRNLTDSDFTSSVKPVDKKLKLNKNKLSKSVINDEYNKSSKSVVPCNQTSDNPTVKKPAAIPVQTNTFPFKIPSTFELKEICKKLEIKYYKEANVFWKEIKFVRIDPFSKNIQTQKFKAKNLYKILSNFFTGRFLDYEQIYFAINSAFRDKLVSDGKVPVEEINELISSYTVTKKHLKFIAKYIPCRIMIFDRDNNDEVKKYGNWKTFDKSNVLTLVLAFSKRKYSVVTNLGLLF